MIKEIETSRARARERKREKLILSFVANNTTMMRKEKPPTTKEDTRSHVKDDHNAKCDY